MCGCSKIPVILLFMIEDKTLQVFDFLIPRKEKTPIIIEETEIIHTFQAGKPELYNTVF